MAQQSGRLFSSPFEMRVAGRYELSGQARPLPACVHDRTLWECESENAWAVSWKCDLITTLCLANQPPNEEVMSFSQRG
jgi:hypothetical protein